MLSKTLGCMSDPEGGQDCRTMVLVCHTVKSQTCLAVLFLALSTASGRRVVSLGWCVATLFNAVCAVGGPLDSFPSRI